MRSAAAAPASSGSLRLIAALVLCSACASSGKTDGDSSTRFDRNVITQEQLLKHRFNNAFDAVQSLHANWLQTKGTDSFTSPSQVWVYIDDTRLGNIETLRTITPSTILFIRYYDGVEATGRWGIDHGQGVIFVATHR